MATLRQILKSLLGIALFVLIILIATICLFTFVWSNSGKCSTSCQLLNNSKVLAIDEPLEDFPNEKWSEIPEELYPFFTPPPRFLEIKTTTPDPCIGVTSDAPVAFVYHVAFNHSFPEGSHEYFRINFRQLGIAAVLLNKWVLMQDATLINLMKEIKKPTLYARVISKYARKGGEVIRIGTVVHFKQLAALHLEHTIHTDCIQYAKLLKHNTEIDNFTIYVAKPSVWNFKTGLVRQSATLKIAAEKDVCTPLFIENKKNNYLLCGFTKCAANKAVYMFKDEEESYRKWFDSL